MYFQVITDKTDFIPIDSKGHYIFNKPNIKYPYKVNLKNKKKIS